MSDSTPAPDDKIEAIRLKQANHSARLEHGDRRMGSMELDLKALKNEQAATRRTDWKLLLSVILAVCTALAAGWKIIDADVDDKIQLISKDIQAVNQVARNNSTELAAQKQTYTDQMAHIEDTRWRNSDHAGYEKFDTLRHEIAIAELAELETKITQLQELIVQLRILTTPVQIR